MATSTIQVDSNNDFFVDSSGNLVLLNDVDAVTQDTKAETLLRLGEDIYNQAKGIDYLGAFFAPQENYDDARRGIITAITSSPDVVSVDSLTLKIDGNELDFVAQSHTIYGPLTVTNK